MVTWAWATFQFVSQQRQQQLGWGREAQSGLTSCELIQQFRPTWLSAINPYSQRRSEAPESRLLQSSTTSLCIQSERLEDCCMDPAASEETDEGQGNSRTWTVPVHQTQEQNPPFEIQVGEAGRKYSAKPLPFHSWNSKAWSDSLYSPSDVRNSHFQNEEQCRTRHWNGENQSVSFKPFKRQHHLPKQMHRKKKKKTPFISSVKRSNFFI